MPALNLRKELAEARAVFRARLEEAGAQSIWQKFPGRIAMVLSGGGPRGAYQAGVLLAFQDACVPTQVIAATSIGSFNAASYASHSENLVGNAEPLVELWLAGATAASTGVEWARYALMLVGLLVASASVSNLLGYALTYSSFLPSGSNPALGWSLLGLAGMALLLFHDRLPYLGYVLAEYFHSRTWKWNRRKAVVSLTANVIVWGLAIIALYSLRFPTLLSQFFRSSPRAAAIIASGIVVLVGLFERWRTLFVKLLRRFFRIPLRPGLFSNFERTHWIRDHVSNERLRASPMRLVFTAADLEAGTPRFFSNTPPGQLAADPGVDARFIAEEVCATEDIVSAVVASSAVPIAFEPMAIEGKFYVDGGLCANQPIRPAVRLGADVLFVVMVQAPGGRRGELDTFFDVGLRSFSILMQQNLLTDMRVSANKNAACERAAAELGVRPEEVEIEVGTRRYRYIPAFAICPAEPLPFPSLDFSGKVTGPLVLQGYRDACGQITNFLAYAGEARFGQSKRVLRSDPLVAA